MNGKSNPAWLTSQQNLRAVQTSVVVSSRKFTAEDLPVPGRVYPHRTLEGVTAYVNAAYDGIVWFVRNNERRKNSWHGSLVAADFLAMYDVQS